MKFGIKHLHHKLQSKFNFTALMTELNNWCELQLTRI